jgi:hypothetical protein
MPFAKWSVSELLDSLSDQGRRQRIRQITENKLLRLKESYVARG